MFTINSATLYFFKCVSGKMATSSESFIESENAVKETTGI